MTRYSLSCAPSGGTAPHAAALCRALLDFIPRRLTAKTACFCPLTTSEITVTGVLHGKPLGDAVEVDPCAACRLGAKAGRDVERIYHAVGLRD